MTVVVSYTENSVVVREPGPAGPQGVAGASLRYQGQIVRTSIGTVSGVVQNVYRPVTLSGTFDSAIASGIVAGSGFALRNNTGLSLVFAVDVATEASAGNQEHLGLILTKNGAIVSGSEIRGHTGNSSSAVPLTIPSYFIRLDNGEEVGIAVADFSASVNIQLERTRLSLSV